MNVIDLSSSLIKFKSISPKSAGSIEYISDSTGQFKYGHPIDSKSYINGLPIHLLIHPEWWIIDGESPIQIIQKVINKNTKMNQIFFQQNSKPYKEFIN